jgi:hypothetical protein
LEEEMMRYCSIYSEHSKDGQFSARDDFSGIDWNQLIQSSYACGMLYVNQFTIDNSRYKVTIWTDHDSYSKWVAQPIVQEYIKQRDHLNLEKQIKQDLIFAKIDYEISNHLR